MRNPRLAVALIVLAVASRVHASEEAASTFVKAIIPTLPVQQEPCRDSFEGAGSGSVLICARPTGDFEAFRQAWDLGVSGGEKVPAVAKPMTEWVTGVGGRMRWYALGDKWIVVTYDTTDRRVVISYPKDKEGVLPLARDITPPRRITVEDSSGEMRRRARMGLSPETHGIVVMSAVIHKDGKIGDAEVLGCLPRHRGLEQAALNAVKSWRYEPATKDGVPVNVSMTSSFTYGPGGFVRTSEGSDTKDIEGGGTSPKGGGGADR